MPAKAHYYFFLGGGEERNWTASRQNFIARCCAHYLRNTYTYGKLFRLQLIGSPPNIALKECLFFNPADPRGITSREVYQEFLTNCDIVNRICYLCTTNFLPFFQSCWPTRDHIVMVYQEFQPSLTSSAGPVPRVVQTTGFVHLQLRYTAQFLTQHRHRANNQWIGHG